MPVVKPSPLRHRIEEEVGTLRVVIPSERSMTSVLATAVWVLVWGIFFVVLVAAPTYTEGIFQASPCVFAWILVWITVSAIVMLPVLGQLGGREILLARDASLAIRMEILGVDRTYEYAVDHVRDLRAVANVHPIGT